MRLDHRYGSLTSIGEGGLDISGNPLLSDISGLGSLTSVDTVVVLGNPSLPECAVAELFTRVGGTLRVCTANDPNGTCP